MLKILIDVILKQSEKVSESIKILSKILVKFLTKVGEESLEKRKYPHKGDKTQTKRLLKKKKIVFVWL